MMNTPMDPDEPPPREEPKSASVLLFFSIMFALGLVVWINRDYLRREWNVPASPAPQAARAKVDALQARARAAEKFPDLRQEDSPLRKAFDDITLRAQVERPEVFQDPEWPTKLATEAAASLR